MSALAEANAPSGEYGYWNETRGVREVWNYDTVTGGATYLRDCGTEPACTLSDAEGTNGVCTYVLVGEASWDTPNSVYSGLAFCIAVKVNVAGTITYRASVRELYPFGNGPNPYSWRLGCGFDGSAVSLCDSDPVPCSGSALPQVCLVDSGVRTYVLGANACAQMKLFKGQGVAQTPVICGG